MSYQHPSWGKDKVYEDSRNTIAKCSFCKSEIKAGNDEFYGDEAYYDHGTWACENCKDDFLKMFRIGTDY